LRIAAVGAALPFLPGTAGVGNLTRPQVDRTRDCRHFVPQIGNRLRLVRDELVKVRLRIAVVNAIQR
jgi:hypothetical protein